MRTSNIINRRRAHVSDETRQEVEISFQIVDRIQDVLDEKGMQQKDLAATLGKTQAEVSRWMRGTHNFTIGTLISIENALGAPILKVVGKSEECYA